ncbi:MAG: hypothetical protein J2P26_04700, partial [Nocardiopsaceae bacterium]|nr:hypothetical protein [Nocardiopsaceae bacterium]
AGSPAGSGGGWSRAQRLIATRLTAAIVAAAVVVVAVIVVATQLVTGGSGAPASGAAAAGQGTPALPVSFDLAYGPNGVADGDNAGSAAYPVTSGATRPWSTQRYSSAEFGQHKAGTGLLLNMGGPVKVTSVTVSLGPGSGAGLQLRAGTSSAELATVASATSAGGEVTLRPGKPVTALYLLVWFTKLPRASGGQYQASVYHITVNGRP